jgi:hypothetical protein
MLRIPYCPDSALCEQMQESLNVTNMWNTGATVLRNVEELTKYDKILNMYMHCIGIRLSRTLEMKFKEKRIWTSQKKII